MSKKIFESFPNQFWQSLKCCGTMRRHKKTILEPESPKDRRFKFLFLNILFFLRRGIFRDSLLNLHTAFWWSSKANVKNKHRAEEEKSSWRSPLKQFWGQQENLQKQVRTGIFKFIAGCCFLWFRCWCDSCLYREREKMTFNILSEIPDASGTNFCTSLSR